jgi:hypothetical protein
VLQALMLHSKLVVQVVMARMGILLLHLQHQLA